MEKKYLFLVLLLLTVGFASVNTFLDLNSKVDLGLLESDLDVIFKEVLLNKETSDKAFIIEDGKSFIYSADDLVELNQTSEIDYTIMNKSHQYDMEVKLTCVTDYGDYLNYTGETIDKSILVEAGEVINGNLITELTKEKEFDDSLVLKCTLYYVPVSRDTIVEDKEYIVSFDTGYEEKVSDIKVKYYEVYGSLPELTRKGYSFQGWYTSEDIKVENNSLVKIKDDHTLYAKWEKVCEYDSGQVWTFSYTGAEQTFTVPCDGEYKIELWGAQGSTLNASYPGGKGAYTMGQISLSLNTNLYFYVGQVGTRFGGTAKTRTFNGGGVGNFWCSVQLPTAQTNIVGAGATDVRLISGSWDNFNSLKSRIMVAGGGGSSTGYAAGGAAGTLSGYAGSPDTRVSGNYSGTAGTQTTGGNASAGFGYGGNANYSGNYCSYNDGAGGGSGYYGGGGSRGTQKSTGGTGAGGSSFISGHTGCNAIAELSTSTNIVHTGQPNHYSGYIFTNTQMVAGNASMPTHDGKSTMTGNSGNGYAKITYLG